MDKNKPCMAVDGDILDFHKFLTSLSLNIFVSYAPNAVKRYTVERSFCSLLNVISKFILQKNELCCEVKHVRRALAPVLSNIVVMYAPIYRDGTKIVLEPDNAARCHGKSK